MSQHRKPKLFKSDLPFRLFALILGRWGRTNRDRRAHARRAST